MYKGIKFICKIIIILFWFMLLIAPVVGCTIQKTHVISTNKFIQTNYDYACLDGSKSFTEIIICYQKQDAAEKAQNNITNQLLNEIDQK